MDEKLSKINQKLNKIKLRIKGNRIYLRGTLPPKPQDGELPRQYDLSTGLPANNEGINIAYGRALEMESRLILDRFSWADYLGEGIMGIKPISLWIEEFTEYYWNINVKTVKKEHYFNNAYYLHLRQLPLDQPLSEKIIIEYLTKLEPSSAIRQKRYLVYKKLLSFANIKHDLSHLHTKYTPAIERDIPTDRQIEKFIAKVSPEYRWIFGMLAAYGLRGHELMELDTSKINSKVPVVYVNSDTKTGSRSVYPMLPEWVSKFNLAERYIPESITKYTNVIDFGNVLSWYCKREMRKKFNQKMTAYYFRDAYAIRCALQGVDSTTASKWMGHSITMHQKSYLKFFDENHHEQLWLNAQKKDTKTAPFTNNQ